MKPRRRKTTFKAAAVQQAKKITKQTKKTQKEPTKLNKQARHPRGRATFRKNKNEQKES